MKRAGFTIMAAVAMGFVTANVQAASMTGDVTLEEFNKATNNPTYDTNDIVPIIYEDDDFSQTFFEGDLPGVGDVIKGTVVFPRIYHGTPLTDTPNASGANKAGGTTLAAADPGFDLSGWFELEVTDFSDGVISIGPVGENNVIAEVYEDTKENFSSTEATYEDSKATVTDGTFVSSIGFTGQGTEFYRITPPAPGADGEFEFSLNYISGPPTPGNLQVARNEFGTTIYGFGSLRTAEGSGWFYDTTSDGDFVTLYVPTPAAVLPGIAMFGLLAIARPMRRRNEETTA